MGKKSLAKKHYESSVEAFKGDARALILARRLGIEKNFDEKTKQFSDKSLLILEKALVHYSGCNYEKALASFDEAFLSLEPFYRQSYGKLRDKSWQLRSVSGEKGLVSLEKLSVLQMILLTNQNPDLLYTYTAGKELSEKDLYKKIAGSGLLNPVSQPLDAENAVTKETTVSRLIAARFLWNLYNQRRNTPQLVTKYSEAYKNKKRSPIPDVKLNSPDFDAALGCVENEIMNLEDGIEFLGSSISITKVRKDGKDGYRSTMHPVFLPLNLTEVYAMTVYLEDVLDPKDINTEVIRNVIGRIKSQLSDYALECLSLDRGGDYPENRYLDDESLAKQREGIRMYLMKSNQPCRFLWEEKEYTGRIRKEKGREFFVLEDGTPLDVDPRDVEFVIESLEYR